MTIYKRRVGVSVSLTVDLRVHVDASVDVITCLPG
jgi:hypothetical protein